MMAVRFSYHSASTTAIVQSSERFAEVPRRRFFNFHNGWSVKTYGAVDPDSSFANVNALALLVSGIALSFCSAS